MSIYVFCRESIFKSNMFILKAQTLTLNFCSFSVFSGVCICVCASLWTHLSMWTVLLSNVVWIHTFRSCIFQQHNAVCHMARNVLHWLEEHGQDFKVLPWPTNFPDLNPMERLCVHLHCCVHSIYPPPMHPPAAIGCFAVSMALDTYDNQLDPYRVSQQV